MTEFKLKALPRQEKAKHLRANGKIPAVIYGNNFKSQPIEIDRIAFGHLFRTAGTSNLIDLTIENEKPVKTLIHDYQKNPTTGELIHVDFFKVNMKEKIHAEIPLHFVGDSPAVINLEGSLITPIDHIEIECLPADLPSEIEVDIAVLDSFDKNIKITDLKLPAGVEIDAEPEEIVAFVQEPRSEEELEALNEEVVENVEDVEVENKGEEAPVEGEEGEKKEEKASE